jgi:hypothetical protein
MPDRSISITDVRLYPGSWRDVQTGLLGWVTFVVGGALRVDGVALRRTLCGRLALSYPIRKYAGESEYHIVRPVDAESRREVERQIFEALGLKELVA